MPRSGTLRIRTEVIEAARLFGVQRVVLASSIAVYGPKEELLTEQSETEPTSA